MIYFIADTHFGHENVIRFCDRPFSSAEEMDRTMIANWNRRVHGNDIVYIIGDMFFRSTNVEEILKKLRGKKHLIIGNHDSSWMTKPDASKYFESIDSFLEFSDATHTFTLCHYPLLTWKHSDRVTSSFMIHGHIHNNTGADFWPLIVARDNVLNAGADIKATPHKDRLTALHASCLHLFRHTAQKLLDILPYACVVSGQSDEKSDGAIRTQSLCGAALISLRRSRLMSCWPTTAGSSAITRKETSPTPKNRFPIAR